MLKETLNSMIGIRVDSELANEIKDMICGIPKVHGAYGLILHNYGPDHLQGSVKIEVDSNLTAFEIYEITRYVSSKVLQDYSIFLSIETFPKNTKYINIQNDLYEIASRYDEVIELYGFFCNEKYNYIVFNLVVDFDADRQLIKDKILSEIKEKYPEFTYRIFDDYDVSG